MTWVLWIWWGRPETIEARVMVSSHLHHLKPEVNCSSTKTTECSNHMNWSHWGFLKISHQTVIKTIKNITPWSYLPDSKSSYETNDQWDIVDSLQHLLVSVWSVEVSHLLVLDVEYHTQEKGANVQQLTKDAALWRHGSGVRDVGPDGVGMTQVDSDGICG